MAIINGGRQIKRIIHNSLDIEKIYRTNQVVFGNEGGGDDPSPSLPYVELEYITIPTLSQGVFLSSVDSTRSDCNYRIEFGYAPDSTVIGNGYAAGFFSNGMIADYNEWIIAVGSSPWNSAYVIWGKDWAAWGTSVIPTANTKVSIALTVTNSSASCTVNGSGATVPDSYYARGNYGHFSIDGASGPNSTSGEGTLSGRWYTVKEYEGGTLVHDYVPAKSLDGTKVGFYDKLTDTWVLCTAGNAWVEGPTVDGSDSPQPEPTIPYDELEYLTIPVSSYFDTGVKLDKEVIWELDIAPIVSGSSTYYAGSSGGSQYTRIGINNKKWYVYNASGATATNGTRYYVKFTLPLKSSTASWKVSVNNGTTTSGSTTRVTNIGTTTLRSKYSSSYNGLGGNYYGMDITYGGTKVGDYIPVRRKSDGVVCFYNKIDDTYLTSASGTWTAGPTK